MTTVTQRLVVDRAQLEALRSERRDLLEEVQTGHDQWGMSEGPFSRYERRLTVNPGPGPRFVVDEQIDFKLAIPYWWPFVLPLMTRALKGIDRRPRKRWWWSYEVITQNTAQLFGSLAVFGLISGYLGVTIGQTLTFAAEEFGVDEAAQSQTLAAVRIGVVLSLIALWQGHRIGRRPMVIGFTLIAIAFSIFGAASPNLYALGATQTVGRGLTTGLISLIALSITEEVPASSRAVSISYMAMATAVGSAMVLFMLPLADLAIWGWRLIYIIPVIFVPLVRSAARQLPETRRFAAAANVAAPARIDIRRFAILAVTGFALAMFVSPASQLRNDFLNDDLGYSALDVSIFQAVIFAPAGIAMMLSGLIADRKGRRKIGATVALVGTVATAYSFQTTGLWLWAAACLGAISISAFIPVFRVYGTELFPTRARARAAGWLDLVGVAGSATGLLIVGELSTRWDGLPPAIAAMLIPAMLAVAVFVMFFPETVDAELETFNPSDPTVEKSTRPPDQLSQASALPSEHGSRRSNIH